MVKVFVGTEHEYYMDGYMKDNLDTAKEVIKKDWDMVFCYDGYEGSGKSVKAQQDAFYCDPTLTNDRIVFTPKKFEDAVLNAKQYQSVVYDEAYTGLSSRATMSQINKTLVKMLAEIRQKNLFIFVVMPTFFDLDKYVALWRSRALIHVYTKGKFERGYFSFYNIDRKKQLYVLGKKYYSYGKPKPNFIGRFTNHYTVEENLYRKNKNQSLIHKEEEKVERYQKIRFQQEILKNTMRFSGDLNDKQRCEIIGITQPTLMKWKRLIPIEPIGIK